MNPSQGRPGVRPPTGAQYEIRHGQQRAVAVELGAALRSYEVAGRQVVAGFAAGEPARGGRGAVLLPWPNRIEEGRYRFDGIDHALAIDDLVDGHAIHGLVRWVPWQLVRHGPASVTLATTIFPRPGYPFLLAARVRYRLSDGGLSVATLVRNEGTLRAPVGLGHHPYLAGRGPQIDDATLQLDAEGHYLTTARHLPGTAEPLEGSAHDFRSERRIGDVVLSATYYGLARDPLGRAWVRFDETRLWMDSAYGYVMLFSGEDLPDRSEHRRSLAVEPMTCPPNAFRSGTGLRVLLPGETLRARWGIVPPGGVHAGFRHDAA